MLFAVVWLIGSCRPQPADGLIVVDAGLDVPVFSGDAVKDRVRESLGQGACWIDVDNDEDADLFVPNGARAFPETRGPLAPWRLYVNEAGRFRGRDLETPAWGLGCAVADVDADGWLDLFVTTASGPDRMLRNLGDGRFEDVTVEAGFGAEGLSAGAAFGDLDADGDADLLVAVYLDEASAPQGPCRWRDLQVMCGPRGFAMCDARLYRNDEGRFRLTPALDGHAGFGLGALILDADGDGDQDLYLANDSSPNHLFINQGDWTFVEQGLTRGVALSPTGSTQAGMGVDAGDLDGDGLEDIVVTNFALDAHNLYRQDAAGMFVDRANQSGMAALSFDALGWSVLLEDFDLDGDLDVFVANGHVYPEVADLGRAYRQPVQLFFNRGDGSFEERPDLLGGIASRPLAARGAASADYDLDGDMDIVVVPDGEPPLLLENRLADDRHWIKVRLRDRPPNRLGVGARVVVTTASGRRQARTLRTSRGYLSSSEPVLVFGLGQESQVREVAVEWPGSDGSSEPQRVRAPAVDTMLTVTRH